MSYDVSLEGDDVKVDHHEEGGTYALGGTDEAWLNVTYNYAEVYRLFDFSIRDLDGKRAGDTIEVMAAIVEKTGTRRFTDYWAPTPGNAGAALNTLLTWARANPDATWSVS